MKTFRVDPAFEQSVAQSAGAAEAVPEPSTGVPEKVPVMVNGEMKYLSFDEAVQAYMQGGKIPSQEEEGAYNLADEQKKFWEDQPLAGSLGAGALGLLKDVPFALKGLKAAAGVAGVGPEDFQQRVNAVTGAFPNSEMVGSAVGFLPFGAEAVPAEGLSAAARAAAEAGTLAKPFAYAGGAAEGLAQRAMGDGIVGKAGQFVARQAGEGLAAGVVYTQNEDTIANHEFTAEDMIHSAEGGLAGAVFQTALGIPLGLVGKGVSKYRGMRVPTAVPPTAGLRGWEEAEVNAAAAEHGVERPFETPTAPLADKPWANAAAEKLSQRIAESTGLTQPEVMSVINPRQEGATMRKLALEKDHIVDKGLEGIDKLIPKMTHAEESVEQALKGIDRAESLRPMMQGVDPMPINKVSRQILTQLEDLSEGLQNAASPGLRARAQQIETILSHHYKSLDMADPVAGLMGIETAKRAAVDIIHELRATPKGGTAAIYSAEVEPFAKAAQDLWSVARAVGEDESLVGSKAANYIRETNEIWSKKLKAGDWLARKGILVPEASTTTFGKKTYQLSLDTLKNTVNGADNYIGNKKMQALYDYFGSTEELAAAAAKHLESSNAPAREALAAHALEMNKLNRVFGSVATDMENAVKANKILAKIQSTGGTSLEETLARGAGTVGATMIGTAFGVPALGGSLGYLGSAVIGASGNPGKLVNQIFRVENIARARAKARASSLEGMINGRTPPPLPKRGIKDYEKIAERFSRLSADPEKVANALAGALGDAGAMLPRISGIVGAKMLAATDYLTNNLPPDKSSSNVLQPQFDRKRPPSSMAARQFGRRLDAFIDPDSIIWHPTREGVETVKQLSPQTYQDIQDQAIDILSRHKKPIGFSVRQKLAFMLDLPTDAIQDPRRWAEFQEALQTPTAKPPHSSSAPVKTAKQQIPLTDSLEMGASK